MSSLNMALITRRPGSGVQRQEEQATEELSELDYCSPWATTGASKSRLLLQWLTCAEHCACPWKVVSSEETYPWQQTPFRRALYFSAGLSSRGSRKQFHHAALHVLQGANSKFEPLCAVPHALVQGSQAVQETSDVSAKLKPSNKIHLNFQIVEPIAGRKRHKQKWNKNDALEPQAP